MRTIFVVDDTTCSNKVIFYQKGENEVPTALKDFNSRENIYVRVYGSVRVFKEERAIVGTKIMEITKHDEIPNHFLQVFVGHNIRTKGVLSPADIKGAQGERSGA
jgi:hypothetical protein